MKPPTEPVGVEALVSGSAGEARVEGDRVLFSSAVSYRSPSGRARLVQVLLVVWTVLASVAASASLADLRMASRLLENPLAVAAADIVARDDRQLVLGVAWLVGFVVTGVVFIVWMLRVYDNVKPLGTFQLRYSRGWVIGGWFVPFLSFVRPKQIMDDLWRASDPALPASPKGAWEYESSSLLVYLWWGSFIVATVAGWVASGLSDVEDLAGWRNWAAADAVFDVLMAASAIAGFCVVARLTQRQEDRAGRLFIGYEPRVGGVFSQGSAAAAVALGTLVVAVLAAAFVVFDAPTVEGTNGMAGVSETDGATLLDELEVGDCWLSAEFSDASDELVPVMAVDVVPCDEPHFGEVYAIVIHPGDETARFPGDEEIAGEAQALCLEQWNETFALTYESSPLDLNHISPSRGSWETGDRTTHCSAYLLASATMSGRAADTDEPLPGTDLEVLDAASCEELTVATLTSAQTLIDSLEALPERVLKRHILIQVRASTLRCSLSDLNAEFAARTGELEAPSAEARALIAAWQQTGYWEGAPFEARPEEVEATTVTVPDEVVEPVEAETTIPAEAPVDEYFLSVGECINEDQVNAYLAGEDYSTIPCGEPHDNEVFFVYEWPEGPYPGDDEVFDELDAICLDEFEGYVGTAYEMSSLDFWSLLPDVTAWKYGERIGECLLYDMDEAKLTGSAQNSLR